MSKSTNSSLPSELQPPADNSASTQPPADAPKAPPPSVSDGAGTPSASGSFVAALLDLAGNALGSQCDDDRMPVFVAKAAEMTQTKFRTTLDQYELFVRECQELELVVNDKSYTRGDIIVLQYEGKKRYWSAVVTGVSGDEIDVICSLPFVVGKPGSVVQHKLDRDTSRKPWHAIAVIRVR